ncbi:polymorphic toxin-type HINT domain-containing protein [Micromonospora rifamycinica]|uniref:polymorphic toxin-type HINT domain-containing protein n=1 Tax=Micromonospora rifamycinica TaxID=291594 RepID=UPI00343871F9
MPLEEFTRRWNEQRGEWFGREFTSSDILQAQDERRLAMNICHDMGRPGGCQQWIEELYNPYIDSLAATLPSDDLIPGGVGGLGAAGSVGRGGSRPSASGGGCKSFSGDTNVLMADGSAKRLDEVQPGDEVLATDPESGVQGPRRVEHVWIHPDELIDLEVGGALLTTTEDHPFWNHTDRQWQRADQLDPGDLVLSTDGHHPVGGLLPSSTQTALAYNLTVNSIHTYYVFVGKAPVLVHNAGPVPCVSTTISRQKQGRHVQGDPLYVNTGKSYFSSHADAQRVLDAYHSGDATVLRQMSNGNIVVRYGNVTGYNNNPGAGFLDQPTNVFMIKGTKSPSVVPINPNWTP